MIVDHKNMSSCLIRKFGKSFCTEICNQKSPCSLLIHLRTVILPMHNNSSIFFFIVVGANFAVQNDLREHEEPHSPRAEEVEPFVLPAGAFISIDKVIRRQKKPNDVVEGRLEFVPRTGSPGHALARGSPEHVSSPNSPSSDHTSHGFVEVYHGTTLVMSATLKGMYAYIDWGHNDKPYTTYECFIHALPAGLFTAELGHYDPGRRWAAGVTHIYFVNHENTKFEGELEQVM